MQSFLRKCQLATNLPLACVLYTIVSQEFRDSWHMTKDKPCDYVNVFWAGSRTRNSMIFTGLSGVPDSRLSGEHGRKALL